MTFIPLTVGKNEVASHYCTGWARVDLAEASRRLPRWKMAFREACKHIQSHTKKCISDPKYVE